VSAGRPSGLTAGARPARAALLALALAGAASGLAACTSTRPPVEIEASGGSQSGINKWRIGVPF
jgi:hypothetical protein